MNLRQDGRCPTHYAAGVFRLGIALVAMYLCTGAGATATATGLHSAEEKASYSAGYEFGGYLAGLKRQGTGVELEAVFRGVLDALSGSQPLMSHTDRRSALDGLAGPTTDDPRVDAATAPRLRARTRGYVDDFAVLNARREGVVSLPSGVQYEVLTAGAGKKPQPGDSVIVRYEGTLTNGAVFDSTYQDAEPARLRMDDLAVPGLKEALLLMNEGAKWRIVIPPSMGFAASGNNMLRRRDLIYEIELVSVEASAQSTAAPTGSGGFPVRRRDQR